MQSFKFQPFTSLDNTLQASNQTQGFKFLAGGTNLVDMMKLHVETPTTIFDLSPWEQNKIEDKGGSIFIGAMSRNSDMAYDELIKKNFPMLSQALLAGASVQLRNQATAAGNLMQRTRCAYFRDTTWACNKREPGSGCAAQEGFNRMHAILGTSSQCIATHPSDMCVALMALDAKVHVRGAKNSRVIAIQDFFKKPEATPHIEHELQLGEIIMAIEIPKTPWLKNSGYLKIRDRASYAFALSSAAVALDLDGKTIQQARIALGGVGTIPWRSPEAEKALQGQPLNLETLKEAAQVALASANAKTYNKYKIILAQQTIVRAFKELGSLT